jgi:A/G-specific adenine glycosylase
MPDHFAASLEPRDKRITKNLLRWYRASRRDLPWRASSDPYRVWVSEVMLQQTQVATVIPYYRRFIGAFPDVAALAAAPLDAVLKHWEGLGYYARARNLHAAARAVVRSHAGRIPDQRVAFRALPGAGDYIAAAVTSIAFGRREAAVDGNVKRVLARIDALEENVDRPAGARFVAERARALLARHDPGDFNQAMMELGALVCRPANPRCDACPVRGECAARHSGDPARYPVRSKRREVPTARIAVGVVNRRGRVLITRRPESGMLGGLWEFPGGKVGEGESAREACAREIREEVSLDVDVGESIARVRHAYSHLRVEIEVFSCRYRGGDVVLDGPVDYRWIRADETDDYAFPRANHKFLPALRRALETTSSSRRRRKRGRAP